MIDAYVHLIKFVLDKGMTISVHDGEEWVIRRSDSFDEIKEIVDSAEKARLRIFKDAEFTMGATVSTLGRKHDDTVLDWTDTPLGNEWIELYEKAVAC